MTLDEFIKMNGGLTKTAKKIGISKQLLYWHKIGKHVPNKTKILKYVSYGIDPMQFLVDAKNYAEKKEAKKNNDKKMA
jgi:hypothetical protein